MKNGSICSESLLLGKAHNLFNSPAAGKSSLRWLGKAVRTVSQGTGVEGGRILCHCEDNYSLLKEGQKF